MTTPASPNKSKLAPFTFYTFEDRIVLRRTGEKSDRNPGLWQVAWPSTPSGAKSRGNIWVSWQKVLGVKEAKYTRNPEWPLLIMLVFVAVKRSTHPGVWCTTKEVDDAFVGWRGQFPFIPDGIRKYLRDGKPGGPFFQYQPGTRDGDPPQFRFLVDVSFEPTQIPLRADPGKIAEEWLKTTPWWQQIQEALDQSKAPGSTQSSSPDATDGCEPLFGRTANRGHELSRLVWRQAEIEKICRTFADPDPKVALIVGMPGMGKTTLAHQYVALLAKLSDQPFVRLVWIDAGAGMKIELRRAALELGWRKGEAQARDYATFLVEESAKRPVLFVVDALPEYGVDLRLIPLATGKSRTLVVSRGSSLLQDLKHPGEIIELKDISVQEATDYLCNSPDLSQYHLDRAAVDRLLSLTTTLPLVVRLVEKSLARWDGSGERSSGTRGICSASTWSI